jgi:hypothetical protein
LATILELASLSIRFLLLARSKLEVEDSSTGDLGLTTAQSQRVKCEHATNDVLSSQGLGTLPHPVEALASFTRSSVGVKTTRKRESALFLCGATLDRITSSSTVK